MESGAFFLQGRRVPVDWRWRERIGRRPVLGVSGEVVGELAIVLVETKDEDIVVQIDLGGFGWIATYWYSVERR